MHTYSLLAKNQKYYFSEKYLKNSKWPALFARLRESLPPKKLMPTPSICTPESGLFSLKNSLCVKLTLA
jgi:hypothetical protein